MSLVDAAHDYGRRGWRVTPLHHIRPDGACSCRLGPTCPFKNRGKHPRDNAWPNTASAAGPDIHAWWDEHPDANIGVVTGPDSGLWVLDIDGAEGFDTITSLAAEHGALPRTRVVRTGSGGIHYYWIHPADFTVVNSTSWIGPGVDVRGRNGQVVAPPSVSARGPYEVLVDAEPTTAPDWLIELIREHAANHMAGRTAKIAPAEPVDVSFLPEKVRTLASTVVEADTGRFKHFYALVAACRKSGYSQGQTVTIAEPWCAAVDKFSGRVAAEVARSWGKLDAADQRAETWMPGITGNNALAPTPAFTATHAVANLDTSDSDDDTDLAALTASWAPINLDAVLDGTWEPEQPTLMPRDDDVHLLYPGRVHSFHGESESGKSLVAQAEAARVLADAGRVAYIDFESDQGAVVTRLRQLGAATEQIRAALHYLRPEVTPYGLLHEREAWSTLLAHTYDLVVIDGVTEALVTYGAGSMDNDEITGWMRRVPRLIAQRTGAAVVLIDHVSKNSESRGRFAIGAQAKLAALDGAAYSVEVVEALGRGMRGVVSMRIGKDRPGAVRPHGGPFRKSDRTQEAARVVIDSTGDSGTIRAHVEAPDRKVNDEPSTFRPTHLMERVSQHLALVGPSSLREIIKSVTGNEKALGQAVVVLVDEGFIAVEKVGQKHLHGLVKPFSEADDKQPSPPSPNRRQTVAKETAKSGSQTVAMSPPSYREATGDATDGAPGDTSNKTQPSPPSPRVVERVVAGERVRFNLDTGEVIE